MPHLDPKELAHKRVRIEKRATLIIALRQWMQTAGFLEVFTPILLSKTIPDANIVPVTAAFCDDRDKKYQARLRVSPEVSLKKLLATGFKQCYELGPVFRSHESFHSPLHSTEFTMLEWYRLGAGLPEIQGDLFDLVEKSAEILLGKVHGSYRGSEISFRRTDWERLSVNEAFKRYANISLEEIGDWATLPQHLKASLSLPTSVKPPVWEAFSPEEAFHWVLVSCVEPNLSKTHGVLLYDYPSFAASFSRPKEEDPRYTLRFEAYLGGLELANAFDELTHAPTQRARMEEAQKKTAKENRKNFVAETIDEDFLTLLPEIGQASGIALGVDRLLMLLSNAEHIQDVQTFSSAELFDR